LKAFNSKLKSLFSASKSKHDSLTNPKNDSVHLPAIKKQINEVFIDKCFLISSIQDIKVVAAVVGAISNELKPVLEQSMPSKSSVKNQG
jgi:hypothetical protein